LDVRVAQQDVDASKALPRGGLQKSVHALTLPKSSTLPLANDSKPLSQSPEFAATIPQDELTPQVRATLAHMQAQIDRLRADRRELSQKLREAENLADTDTLVPVFNRRAFVRELTRVMGFAQRYDVQASLLFFDLDGFKQINDRFGHPAGDAVLKSVGQVLLHNIRDSDLVGRVGGDEFAVILAKAGPSDARHKGAQLATRIAQTPIPYLGHKLSIGAAVGAYTFEPGDTAELALSRADEAMYAHKMSGKIQSL
jgi:diguanylate cyclase (GGDEF)-like protein